MAERESTTLEASLQSWIAATTGSPVHRVERVAGGGRRRGFTVDLEDGRQLFLTRQVDAATAELPTLDLADEARLLTVLADAGVPVPRVEAISPDGLAVLATRVDGSAAYSRVADEAEKLRVAQDFMRCLAAVHSVDPRDVGVTSLTPDGDARHHLLNYLDTWEDFYCRGPNGADPLIEYGLAWLRRNPPRLDRAPVIVQGDTGPGNFLFHDGRVTAVLDWELAHLGDPLEDLAWLSMRTAQEPIPDLADRFVEYEKLSGNALDLDRIRYFRVLAEWTIALVGHLKPRTGLGDSERGNAIVYEQLHRRLTVEALYDALGRTPPDLEIPEVDDTASTWMFDMALDQIRESVLPHVEHPLAARRAKGVARVVKVLREIDRRHGVDDELEHESLYRLVPSGPIPAMREALARAIRAGEVEPDQALDHLWLAVTLDNERMRPAMGRLADEHMAALPEA